MPWDPLAVYILTRHTCALRAHLVSFMGTSSQWTITFGPDTCRQSLGYRRGVSKSLPKPSSTVFRDTRVHPDASSKARRGARRNAVDLLFLKADNIRLFALLSRVIDND